MEYLEFLKSKEKKSKVDQQREKSIGKIVKGIISCNGYRNKDEMIELWGESSKGSGNLNLKPLYGLVNALIKLCI